LLIIASSTAFNEQDNLLD